jgi:hypothetical protein
MYIKNDPIECYVYSSSQLYGKVAPAFEVNAFIKEIERKGGKISLEQFIECAVDIRAKVQQLHDAKTATEFKSNEEFRGKMFKNQRVTYNAQQKYRVPPTTSSEYGWHAQVPHEYKNKTFPRLSCPETIFAGEMQKAGVI